MERIIALYVRVSSRQQDTRSQEPDLKRWAEAYADSPVKWFSDKFTGKTMDRPGWKRLEADMISGKVAKVVVWRLDRLGRTAAGLTALFEDFQRRNIGFEALRDKVDLSTAAGRLMANVLASVAAYENEVRSERIRAGQAVARANGKRWGGKYQGKAYQRNRRTDRECKAIESRGQEDYCHRSGYGVVEANDLQGTGSGSVIRVQLSPLTSQHIAHLNKGKIFLFDAFFRLSG